VRAFTFTRGVDETAARGSPTIVPRSCSSDPRWCFRHACAAAPARRASGTARTTRDCARHRVTRHGHPSELPSSGTNTRRLQSGAFDPLADRAPVGAAHSRHIPDTGLPAGVRCTPRHRSRGAVRRERARDRECPAASVVSVVPDDTNGQGHDRQRTAFRLSSRFAGGIPATRVARTGRGPKGSAPARPRGTARIASTRPNRTRVATSCVCTRARSPEYRGSATAVTRVDSERVEGAGSARGMRSRSCSGCRPSRSRYRHSTRRPLGVDSGVRDLFATNAQTWRLRHGLTEPVSLRPTRYPAQLPKTNSAGFAHVAFREE